jgi:septum formation protein
VSAPPKLILASASPRRRDLLRQIGVVADVCPVDVDESRREEESPASYVQRLALAKARAAYHAITVARPGVLVLGADTAVALNGEVFGKPASRSHCLSMLARLSGNTHQVYSAVALIGAREETCLSVSSVSFRDIAPTERLAYWASGEPQDKAGGYAIQGLGAVFVRHLEGSYSGVMGLPLCETALLLRSMGVPLLPPAEP